MRAVFQLPASMTSVVDAPRAVSSDASPTRPLCADFRGGRAPRCRRRGAGGSGEAALNLHRRQPDHPIRGCGVGPVGADGADRFRAAVLQIPHVGGVPLLIRFRGPHGEKHAVAVAGVRHVGPAQGGDFRPPQPAHKQQAGDHGVESAPALRRGVGFDAPAVSAGTVGGGENRGEPVRAQRGGVGERGGPPPGVQARQRAEVGPSGVEAETRVGEPARGRRGDGQRPRRVGASGERGRFGRCCLNHNAFLQRQFAKLSASNSARAASSEMSAGQP